MRIIVSCSPSLVRTPSPAWLLTFFCFRGFFSTVTAVEEKTDTSGFITLTRSTLTLNWRRKQSGSPTPQLQLTSHSTQSGRRKNRHKCIYSLLSTSPSVLHLNWAEVSVQLRVRGWLPVFKSGLYTSIRLLQIKEKRSEEVTASQWQQWCLFFKVIF